MYSREENNSFFHRESIQYCDLKIINPLNLFFLGLSRFEAKQDFAYRKHCHPAYEIIIPQTAGYKCLLNGDEISVQTDELLMVQEGDWHQDILLHDTAFTVISFALHNPGDGHLDNSNPANADVKRKLFKDEVRPLNQKINYPTDKIFTLIFEQLLAVGINENHYNTFYIMDSLFRTLFWKIIFLYAESQLSPIFLINLTNEAKKRALFKIFEKYIHHKLDIRQMAIDMNMSKSSFSHKYRAILGEPPGEAFMRYKLSRVESFLKDQQMTIKEIAEIFGFENQFHFSRTFKRFYGIGPKKYRETH